MSDQGTGPRGGVEFVKDHGRLTTWYAPEIRQAGTFEGVEDGGIEVLRVAEVEHVLDREREFKDRAFDELAAIALILGGEVYGEPMHGPSSAIALAMRARRERDHHTRRLVVEPLVVEEEGPRSLDATVVRTSAPASSELRKVQSVLQLLHIMRAYACDIRLRHPHPGTEESDVIVEILDAEGSR
jgi:hypothetical protein